MKYHIVDGFKLIPQLKLGANLSTTAGQPIQVTAVGSSVVLNNVSTISSNNDIICTNGVVQPIDTVLVPPIFGRENIAEILIMQDGRFSNSFLYFYFADLMPLLEGGEYTLFAPVDMAWGPYADEILHPRNLSESTRYHAWTEMMKYHVIPGARTTDMLHDGQQLYTLHGYPINITVNNEPSGKVIKAGWAKVIDANIPASNGVVHAIDNVLFPLDMIEELKKEIAQQQNQQSGR